MTPGRPSCLKAGGGGARWSFSLNFLPLVRVPILSGYHTKNIWWPMKREDFDFLSEVRMKI